MVMKSEHRKRASYHPISIVGARSNNLKNVTLEIAKHQIVVFTGVSGSGKSSLVFDTIAAESQKQLNETYSSFVRHRLPHYGQPDADALQNLPASIVVDQKRLGGSGRSTVGTATDIYALLRLLFSRAGEPFVGESSVFSFNNPQGMCHKCSGLGTVNTIDLNALFDRDKSLNEGAILFPGFAVGGARWKRYVLTGLFDNDKKLSDYTDSEWQTLVYADGIEVTNPLPGWYASTRYEGVMPRLQRTFLNQEAGKLTQAEHNAAPHVIIQNVCLLCQGARLNETILQCKINGRNIAECSAMEVRDLVPFVRAIDKSQVAIVVTSIIERLEQMASIGLDYLSLSRVTGSLSGGESQRVKMVRHLGSSLSDIAYIFDEPSVGLHPSDVHQLNELLRLLRDRGNTVLVVEHDPDVIAIADHIVDMGPGAGKQGGNIVYEGNYSGLLKAATLTGRYLAKRPLLKIDTRVPRGYLRIDNASMYNLKNVSVDLPKNIMTVITGVAGSGKSTLVNRILPRIHPNVICIGQGALSGSRRSTPASYVGVLDEIRRRFAATAGESAGLFSSNSQGACLSCKGLGVIQMDMAFMDTVESPCETCQGSGFSDEARSIQLNDRNIAEVMAMTIVEASDFFAGDLVVSRYLDRLKRVGLSYMSLGQRLNTLSGGECQRLKLATKLEKTGYVYVFDEPTSGLHMADIERLLSLFDELLAQGSTVLIVEHNLDVMAHADWIIEMGPGAGKYGGKIVFEGPPSKIIKDTSSITGHFLKKHVSRKETAE